MFPVRLLVDAYPTAITLTRGASTLAGAAKKTRLARFATGATVFRVFAGLHALSAAKRLACRADTFSGLAGCAGGTLLATGTTVFDVFSGVYA